VTQVSLLHTSEHILQKFHSNDDVFNANYMSSTSEVKEPQVHQAFSLQQLGGLVDRSFFPIGVGGGGGQSRF